VEFGGAEQRTIAITLQSSSTFFSAALRATQQLCFSPPVSDAVRVILF
jgi:hypothetical protein